MSGLVLYPQGLDSSSATDRLIENRRRDGRSIVVISLQPIDRKDVKQVKYTDLDTQSFINQHLIFDSIHQAVEYVDGDKLTDLISKNRVDIIGTDDIDDDSLRVLKKVHPTGLLLIVGLDCELKIMYQVHPVSMTVRQAKMYTPDKPYLSNLVYPDAIHCSIESSPFPGLDRRVPTPDDIIQRKKSENGYYELGPYIDALADAPKIKGLILFISLNRDQRHLVFSRYIHHYGVEMLEAVLTHYGFKVMAITVRHSIAVRAARIRTFNSDSSYEILVTNIIPESPRNIHNIHVLDAGFKNVKLLTRTTFQCSNYNQRPGKLVVHYHLTLGTKDAEQYLDHSKERCQNEATWNRLKAAATVLR